MTDMTPDLLEQLLYEEESDSLDFKSEQYKLVSATDDEKSELLKDILAFANSWCRTDAWILIGVREVKGGRSEIIGVADQLEDASLQQFVNKKTNRPIAFSYRALSTDEGTIAVIKIPRQERPFYLEKDFGKLKAQTVYVRRGSSTDEASLDEISKMGQIRNVSKEEASLDLSFADCETGEDLGRSFLMTAKVINYDEASIPRHGTTNTPFGLSLPYDWEDNNDFFKEYAAFEKQRAILRGVRFVIRNTGTTLLRNVRIKIRFELPPGLVVVDNDDYPNEPVRRSQFLLPVYHNFHPPLVQRRSVSVSRNDNHVSILGQMLDVQPKDNVSSADVIYFGGLESGEIHFLATVFADNLPDPREFEFAISVNTLQYQLDIETLIARLQK